VLPVVLVERVKRRWEAAGVVDNDIEPLERLAAAATAALMSS
jgi:hypothetical protein